MLNKADSSSGVGRSTADALALQTFIESAGLGVGVGSTRASSFLATLLATTGLPGVLAFGAFAVTLVQACYRSADNESRQLCFALIGFLIVWIIAIPDLVQATFWLVAGVASGHLRRQVRASIARTGRSAAMPGALSLTSRATRRRATSRSTWRAASPSSWWCSGTTVHSAAHGPRWSPRFSCFMCHCFSC